MIARNSSFTYKGRAVDVKQVDPKYSCSGSSLTLLKGKTAIDGLSGCPCHRSNADILMMQSTEDRPELDASDCLQRAPNWRVFRQRQVRSNSVVVIHVGQQ